MHRMKNRSSLAAILLGALGVPEQQQSLRPSLPFPVVTNPQDRAACVAARQQRNSNQKRRQRAKAIRNKNRPLVASKKGFAPRVDGGYGDGPKRGR